MSIEWDRSWWARASITLHQLGRLAWDMGSLILPDECSLCEGLIPARIGGGVCPDCLRLMPIIEHACRRCGTPVPPVVGIVEDCVHCRDGHWPADRILAWGVYRDKLREAVVQMKSPGSEPVSFTLGRKLGKWLKSQPDLPCYDRIVSTPKHWWKRFSRHHNSAEFLAEQIGSVLRVPVDHRLLIRTRATAKQGTLMKQARKENVLGAFAVRSPHRVRGRAILLVDDIVTSGATAGEMAKVLLKSGAARVDVACLARGIGK